MITDFYPNYACLTILHKSIHLHPIHKRIEANSLVASESFILGTSLFTANVTCLKNLSKAMWKTHIRSHANDSYILPFKLIIPLIRYHDIVTFLMSTLTSPT